MKNIQLICDKILQKEIANVEDCLYAMPDIYMPQEIILLNKKQNFSWEYYFENFDDLRKSIVRCDNKDTIWWGNKLSLTERKELLKFVSENIKGLINKNIKDKDFWEFLPDNFWTTELFVKKQNVIDWKTIIHNFCYIQEEKIRMLLPLLISNKKFWKCISSSEFRFTLEEIIVYQNYINWNIYFDRINDKKMMNKLKKILINNSNFTNSYNKKYNNWYKIIKKRIKIDRYRDLLHKKENAKKKKEMEKILNHNYNEDFFINYHIS